MPEYVEREAAIHAVIKSFWSKQYISDVELAQAIRDIDGVDVVERRRGKWEKDPDMRRWHGHIYDYRCSLCHTLAEKGYYNNHDRLTNYCPTCGADMRGE